MAYFIVQVPKPEDIRTAQVSTISPATAPRSRRSFRGRQSGRRHHRPDPAGRGATRRWPPRTATYYSNPGFSFKGFFRAFKNNIFGGDLQGGSTITQQYVKNALVVRRPRRRRGHDPQGQGARHLHEDGQRVVQGRGDAGPTSTSSTSVAAHTASRRPAQAYFGKPIELVNVAEGALLAALIQRPSTLDPAVDPEGALERWNWVLDGMVTIGALSPQDRRHRCSPRHHAARAGAAAGSDDRANGLIEAAGHARV